jgi:Fe-S cluster assembly ATPase SufC
MLTSLLGRTLDVNETKQALKDLNMSAEDDDVKLLFAELDVDGSGESFIRVLLVGHHDVSSLSSPRE